MAPGSQGAEDGTSPFCARGTLGPQCHDGPPPGQCPAGSKVTDAPAITTEALTKRYGERTVVDELTFSVPASVISGFIGPNGAGKSTTIRMLLGLVRPTSGAGHVLGKPLDAPEHSLERVGALIEAPAFYPTLSARDNLQVLARLGGLAPDLDALLDRVGLLGRSADPVRAYSLGMKQRLGIAAALISDPMLLILDEPTNGLDPEGIAETRELLRSLAEEGRTILVSSHLLAEIEQICEHLVVIRAGRLLFEGDVSDLVHSASPQLRVRPEHPADLAALAEVIRPVVPDVRFDAAGLLVDGDEAVAGRVNRMAMSAGITLVELHSITATLEEAFFELTEPTDAHGASAPRDLAAGLTA